MNERKPRISILYCTQCNWLLRAGWMAQELLQASATALERSRCYRAPAAASKSALTRPIIWERKREQRAETEELKQRVRDVIEPNRDLGHVDRS